MSRACNLAMRAVIAETRAERIARMDADAAAVRVRLGRPPLPRLVGPAPTPGSPLAGRRPTPVLDRVLSDIARAGRHHAIRGRKARARRMLANRLDLFGDMPGRAAVQPREGIAECLKQLADPARAWCRDSLLAALLAFRVQRRAENRDLAALEAA